MIIRLQNTALWCTLDDKHVVDNGCIQRDNLIVPQTLVLYILKPPRIKRILSRCILSWLLILAIHSNFAVELCSRCVTDIIVPDRYTLWRFKLSLSVAPRLAPKLAPKGLVFVWSFSSLINEADDRRAAPLNRHCRSPCHGFLKVPMELCVLISYHLMFIYSCFFLSVIVVRLSISATNGGVIASLFDFYLILRVS